MKQHWYKFLCFLLLTVAVSAPLVFAANGKITGTVRDAATKDAIPGANVVVVGTTLGGAADAQGRYFILNVPPGTYTIQASAVGYAKLKVEGVSLTLDQTQDLNINLRSEAVQLGDVVISAERRVVDKNRTSTKTTVTSDELQNLPTVSVVDLLSTTPGAFHGFVRGGQITETKTLVEGVDITNQLYEYAADNSNQGIIRSSGSVIRSYTASQLSTNTSLNFSSIEQFSLNTGATGAETPSATAGTINYSLKEGSGKLTGSIQARVSQFNGLHYAGPDVYNLDYIYFNDKNTTNTRLGTEKHQRDSIVAAGGTPSTSLNSNLNADSIRSSKYVYTPGRYLNNNKPLLDFEGSIGGNITDAWRFFLTGKYYDSHGYFPNERNREADLTLKTSYNLTNEIKLSGFGIVNDKGQLFGWKNSNYADQTRYFLEGTPRNNGLDWVGSLKLTHVLNPSTFYEVQLSQTFHNYQQGYTDGNGDGYCALNEDGDFLKLETPDQIAKYISQAGQDLGKFFRIGDEAGPSQINTPAGIGNTQVYISRPQFYYENSQMISRTLKGDLTSQVDFHHQLKAGFQLRFHDISKTMRISMLGSDATDTRARLMEDQYHFFPTEMSGYASDRMEFSGLVINLGLRLDRFDPNAADYRNYYNPAYADTILVDGQRLRNNVAARSANKVDPYWFVSHRIGVSHPISETAALFYSYSRQAIPPPFSRLYDSYRTVFGAITSIPGFVSLQQDLIKSSNYELGAQWEFLPGKLGLNFTAYMRDVQNYNNNVAISMNLPTGQVVWWFNQQYADARGVELSIQAARQRYFDILTVSGRASYAYTYIKASGWTGNDPTQPTLFNATDSSKYSNKLPFGDFQYYNKVQNDISGGQSTLTGGYDRTHRITYTMALEFPEDIILSSIGTFQSGFFYPVYYPQDARVAGRLMANAPWNKMVDVRLEKGFTLSGVRFAVFAEVKNLFNWVNIIGYDNTASGAQLWEATNGNGTTLTNPPGGTGVATGPDPTGTYKRALGQDGSWFYDIPREYYFGIRVDL